MDTSSAVSDKESMLDPFLVEALRNHRHRLTILRMELDIQRFLQSAGQKLFEFQYFPSSYLRLAAHRVAQHYGLRTMVQDTSLDGIGNKILAFKTVESKFPAVRLSDIPAKQSENDKCEQIKIVIRSRSNNSSGIEADDYGVKRSSMRSIEERKEEYDRARACIFNSSSGSESDGISTSASIDQRDVSSGGHEDEACRISLVELDKDIAIKEGSSSRVAILKDTEKDLTDPDHDRSYERYARNIPNHRFGVLPFSMQKIHQPYGDYDAGFAQLGQILRAPASLNYMCPSAAMSPFCSMGLSQGTSDAAYMQWPSTSVIYVHPYEQFRHGVSQAPSYQQPLSFDYSQHH